MMEEVIDETQTKPEIKEEYIPLDEEGIPLGSITNTKEVKKDDEGFTDTPVKTTKEEQSSGNFETKSAILFSLVKNCGGLKVKNEQDDDKKTSLIEGGIGVKTDNEESITCHAESSNTADSEKTIEDDFPECHGSFETEVDFRNVAYLLNNLQKPSSPLHSNPIKAKKIYVRERKYKCRYCDKGFPQSGILKQHLRLHTGEKPYECSFCCLRFISKSRLKRHSLNHTGKPFGCSFCGKRFLQSQGLRTHLLIHEGQKPFQCAYCNKSFRAKTEIIRHIKRVHMQSQDYEERQLDALNINEKFDLKQSALRQVKSSSLGNNLVCHECGKTFSQRCNLQEHLNKSHSSDIFVCHDCGKTFKCRDSITMHIKRYHIPNENYRYCCTICGFASTTKTNCKKHEKLHDNVYLFKCKYCNMSFKQNLTLKSHYKQTHGSERPYKCVECDSSFKIKYNLISHIEVHHRKTEKKFSCVTCKMEFNRMCYLKRHMETHTNADKKFTCDDCGIRCRSKTDIAKHVLTHIGAVEKSHKCKLCGAGFSKHSHLSRHMRVHSDKKAFPCQLCDKAYKDPYSLKEHNETVHQGVSFSCNVCNFNSGNRHSFQRHIRECHD